MALSFSTESEARIAEALGEYYNPQAALIPVLFIAADQFGALGPEVLDLVATRLGLPRMFVEGVSSFYTMLPKAPRGRYHFQVCRTLSCAMLGAPVLTEHLKERLGIKPGEVSADGRYSLEEVECLALCGSGPAMLVNQTAYQNLTVAELDRILASLG